jgi:hypothetical protein
LGYSIFCRGREGTDEHIEAKLHSDRKVVEMWCGLLARVHDAEEQAPL